MVAALRDSARQGRARRDSRGQRQVLAALTGRDVPVTAQTLFIELRGHGDELGLATVYRALHVLRDEGRVHEFLVEDGIAFRACAQVPHHHLICLQCARVLEQEIASISTWLDDVERRGFSVQTCTVEVYGICERCRPA